jgi:signal transduction histidine kinase
MGAGPFAIMQPHLERYQQLLGSLAELEQKPPGQDYQRERDAIQLEMRDHGQKMVALAEGLVQKEKETVSAAMTRFRTILIFSLCFLTAFMLVVTWLLKERIMTSISRFGSYAQRIAVGDYTPITPVRKYRDEFSVLAVGINQMIDEIEKREDFLIQSHKMRAVGTLTAGVAHELNNPLNNIMLTAHMLLEDYPELADDQRQEMVSDMVDEVGRAQKIIRNLLDFARESGSTLEPLDLKELMQETVKLAANQVRLSGIKTELSAVDNMPRVHGDRQQLQQVFLNLILNAMDASPKGAKIQIMVLPADEPNYLAVKVVDHGAGIPTHVATRIFDPFFTTKAPGKGTGLGLSVSQGIVVKHGGKISANSREGAGSTFTVTLPITTIPADI